MNKPNLSKIIKSMRVSVSKHSPEILTGIGIAGMITTTVLAVKATPKALKLIEQRKWEIYDKLNEDEIPSNNTGIDDLKLKPLEIIQVAWKPYIPVYITATVSVACLIGASSVNARRNAALATAYQLSQTALAEYKEKVIETIGEKKEAKIKESIDKDKIDKNPVSTKEIIITGNGESLCYDSISGRYFKSDIDKIKKAENELNARLIREDYISLNEFYYEIGLKPTSLGNELGWNVAKDGLIDLNFTSQLSDDGTPCLVVDYHIAPRYDYSHSY